MISDKKKLSNLKRNLLFYLTGAIILIADQVSKYFANKTLPENSSIKLIPNLLYITHVRNSGAAFGMFQNGTTIFAVISIIAVILIIILRIKINLNSAFYHLSLGFILGGAMGNLVDRLFVKEVTDFIHVDFFAVFNIADSFIVIGFGCIILILLRILIKKEKIEGFE